MKLIQHYYCYLKNFHLLIINFHLLIINFQKFLIFHHCNKKLRNDINTNAITNVNYNSSKYHTTTKLSPLSSSSSSSLSLINQSKRSIAAKATTTTTTAKSIYSTNDKMVNAYLTKSKISSTVSPTTIKIKNHMLMLLHVFLILIRQQFLNQCKKFAID
ncbi:hypothetical protein WUBG_16596 [Wuchereria bancrofti]|uniref:Uncharacterized protein n=1 Tax=Wuchereria bancrofti TaxID=6293 RepID=J9DSB7_WUCBA|nr:hypothetical protein WUBG_16596 [Wuchereria bancrofti]